MSGPLEEEHIIQAAKRKLQKEAFVSGLSGGTISEINAVTLIAPASVLLWAALQSRQSFFTPYTPVACLVDFLLNVGAILSVTTIYSGNPVALNFLLLTPAILIILSGRIRAQKTPRKPAKAANGTGVAKNLHKLPIKPFVTTYRGTMMVITCVAILAVDFRIFPRRFAKVENWGTSLMDIGVGSFVFSAGTVAARNAIQRQRLRMWSSTSSRLIDTARHSTPLLVLGLVRLYSVKGLDYAEHVSEYGVHWNFFFTLGLLPPFMAVCDVLVQIIPSYTALALLVGVGYQVVLESTPLKAYILTAERTDLLSQNREGIFSFFGYLAIFLAGQATGMLVLPRVPVKPNAPITSNPMLRRLLLRSAVSIALFLLTTTYRFGAGLSVSRRLANLPYVLWVAAFNTTQILMFASIEAWLFPDVHHAPDGESELRRAQEASSGLLRAFNRNGLAVFLLANLLTGLVNLTMDTLAMDRLQSMAVLLVYAATLSGVALALDAYNISIKL